MGNDVGTPPDGLEVALQGPGDHQEAPSAVPVPGTADAAAEVPGGSAAEPAPAVKLAPRLKRKFKTPYYQRKKAEPLDPLDSKQLTKLALMHDGRPCPLCDHTEQAKELEKAYHRWMPLQEMAEFFGYKRHIIKAHADAKGWTKMRAESTPEIYMRLMDELMENFDASKLPQKTIAELIVKVSRWNDRLQGKVVTKVDVNEHKSVVFMSVPLPGGDPPLLPGASAPQLGPAKVINATWEDS